MPRVHERAQGEVGARSQLAAWGEGREIMSLIETLRRNLRDILVELQGNPTADVRTWLQHMVSLAELIHQDTNVVKRTAERNMLHVTPSQCYALELRSASRPRLEGHDLELESATNSSDTEKTE